MTSGRPDSLLPHRRLESAPATPDGTPSEAVDSSGRSLAVGLPDWDLLPPTELLNRARPR
jgi:hypothetical protein